MNGTCEEHVQYPQQMALNTQSRCSMVPVLTFSVNSQNVSWIRIFTFLSNMASMTSCICFCSHTCTTNCNYTQQNFILRRQCAITFEGERRVTEMYCKFTHSIAIMLEILNVKVITQNSTGLFPEHRVAYLAATRQP